jgi:hypothetical protein
MSDMQMYDEGSEIIVTIYEDGVAIDISSATVKKFLFQMKDRTTLLKDADFFTDGTDGKLHYFTSGSDFVVKGKVIAQAYVEMPSGKWHTSKIDWEVKENITIA